MDDSSNQESSHMNNVSARVAQFELNYNKQTAAICKDASAPDFTIILKDKEKNVNIECNSGFYAQVAKPTIFALAKDYISSVMGFSIECDGLVKNLDKKGNEYNLVLTFKLRQVMGDKLGKVTIHTHHSARMVQVQGGGMMPGKLKAAKWFLKYVIYEKFQSLAVSKKYDIKKLNEALARANASPGTAFINDNKCDLCSRSFDSRTKPTFCSRCSKWYHKSSCIKDHRCPRDSSSFQSVQVLPNASSDTNQLSRATNIGISYDSSAAPAIVTNCDSTLSMPAQPVCSIGQFSASYSSNTHVERTALGVDYTSTNAGNDLTRVVQRVGLNPNASQFIPTSQNKQNKKKNTRNNDPLRAENDSLKVELSFTRTKIIELESKLNDKEQSNKILNQKVKLLEEGRHDYYKNKYFPTRESHISGFPKSECSCQLQARIIENSFTLSSISDRLSKIETKILEMNPSEPNAPSNAEPPCPSDLENAVSSPIRPQTMSKTATSLTNCATTMTAFSSAISVDTNLRRRCPDNIEVSDSSDSDSEFNFEHLN